MASATPVNPRRVFTELSPRLPDGVILTRIPVRAQTGTPAT
jgi:hypothetical protein